MKAKELIETAGGELGYIEKASNTCLDSKTSNVGSANFTKYGHWYGINPGAWCAMFVSWCFYRAAGSKNEAKSLLCGNIYSSCTTAYNAFKKAGRLYDKPRAGDLIFFNKSPGSQMMSHIGIVSAVKNGRVYTIEGNTGSAGGVVANGGCVAAKDYSSDYKRIGGYGRPLYETEKEPTSGGAEKKVELWLPMLSVGAKGKSVKALQILLEGYGFPCGGADGDFGSKTASALRKYQSAEALDADAVAGINTWTALLA
ncbi:MAG: CHAP domain-containing protein [Oscillospiraceae bacterium]|nr:CHAP domain-containing protein [Oscillospiraceae bacterium]